LGPRSDKKKPKKQQKAHTSHGKKGQKKNPKMEQRKKEKTKSGCMCERVLLKCGNINQLQTKDETCLSIQRVLNG
jgi:hypothetical protein